MISRSTLIAALVVVELAILGAAAKAIGPRSMSPFSFAHGPHIGMSFGDEVPRSSTLDKTFLTGPSPHVVLDVDKATVSIQAAPGSGVHVMGTMHVGRRISGVRPALTAVRTADGVLVAVESGLVRGSIEREVRLTVPVGAEIEIRSAGSVSATGLRAKLVAHLADGGIRIANHRGDVDVATASGDIELLDVQSPSIVARTDDGALKLTSSGADRIDARTASGAIVAVGLRAVDGAVATSDGHIDVSFAAESDATVNLHTEDGRITGAGAATTGDDSADTRSLRLGSGRGRFALTTASGPIVISQGATV
jgi:Putative adhesin